MKENKLIRRIQARQERDLGHYQRKEGELPQLLQRHDQEVKSLREQLKRSQQKNLERQKKITEQR